jgi:L-alanine-DL-glutamate epimerase-like enolase superfamily enzyme
MHRSVWLGIMVCSIAGATSAAHLLPLSTHGGDVDGALLTMDECSLFDGGLSWGAGQDYGVVQLPSTPGLGCTRRR